MSETRFSIPSTSRLGDSRLMGGEVLPVVHNSVVPSVGSTGVCGGDGLGNPGVADIVDGVLAGGSGEGRSGKSSAGGNGMWFVESRDSRYARRDSR